MKAILFSVLLCVGLATADEKVVYGTDDRTEPYTISDSNVQTLIQADVAVLYASQLTEQTSTYKLQGYNSYDGIQCPGTYLPFCSSEPFKGQVEAAFCSGFLVRNDANSSRIVTAGHCLNGDDCAQMAFIFDFKMTSASSIEMNIPKANVYFCKKYYYELSDTTISDFGVVELDRQVTGRTALTMRSTGTITDNTPLYMVGHPTGIPMKVDDGAVVKSVSTRQFTANTDSYAGNSGSMIVNANTWEVEGILVEGNQDFKESGGCCVSNACSDSTGCPSFEVMSKISQAYDWVYSDLPYNGTTDTVDEDSSSEDSGDAWTVQPVVLLMTVLTFLTM